MLELRKQWDAEADEGRDTVRRRLLAAAGELQTALSTLAENPDGAAAAHALIRTALGFPEPLADYTGQRAGTELRLPLAQLAGCDRARCSCRPRPVETIDDLLDPETGLLLARGRGGRQAHRLGVAGGVRGVPRRRATRPSSLVLAGQWVLLAERERWAEGRYLAVDLQVVSERNDDKRGGEIDRHCSVLGRQSLVPDADGNIWWTGVLEESVKHTVGVSKDLREGVRLSIEIIANDVVRRRGREGPAAATRSTPSRWPSSRCGSSTGSCSCSTPRRPPSCGCCRSGAPEYDEGYSLDRLRELTLTELVSPTREVGHPPLRVARRRCSGWSTAATPAHAGRRRRPTTRHPDSTFNALRADLFRPEATALIDEVGLGNAATPAGAAAPAAVARSRRAARDRPRLHLLRRARHQPARRGVRGPDVLHRLLRRRGPLRGRQERRPGEGFLGGPGDPRRRHLSKSDFVTTLDEATGEPIPVAPRAGHVRLPARRPRAPAVGVVLHARGADQVRGLARRSRNCSTRTASAPPPSEILELTICEPALGSGAFAIEAVRQLAARVPQAPAGGARRGHRPRRVPRASCRR